MGTSRRYSHVVDKRMDDRILQRIADAGPLDTLTKAELELDREPYTRDPQPKPVRAWVRFGDTPVQVDAEACAWTTNALAIRFTINGTEHRTWVWASAATPLQEASPAR